MVPRRRPASVARTALLLGSLLAIAGCDVLGQADIIRNLRKEPSGPEVSAPLTEQGLGKLAKGEMIAANALFDQALKANPADVYALMGKGLILQRWNEPSQARQAYQAVLALHPDPSVKIATAGSPEPQSILELATANLEALEDAGVAQGGAMLAPATQQAMQNVATAPVRPASVTSGRAAAPSPFLNEGDANTMARFETLGKLRDQGLITLTNMPNAAAPTSARCCLIRIRSRLRRGSIVRCRRPNRSLAA